MASRKATLKYEVTLNEIKIKTKSEHQVFVVHDLKNDVLDIRVWSKKSYRSN